ncbi:MAG: helix-turn-helix domain-containing protein [Opitutaceae bacterium]
MSLVKSQQLFAESAFPVTVDTLVDRTLIQKELHRHEYFEMIYVDKGTMVNRFISDQVVMEAGDVLILKPYVRHVLEDDDSGESMKAYCCSFLPQVVDFSINSLEELKVSQSPNKFFFKPMLSLAEENVSAVHLKVPKDQRESFVALFDKLKELSHDYTGKGFALTRCYFLNLLTTLAEQYELDNVNASAVQSDVSVQVSRYKSGLRKALNYIHAHYDKTISLEEVAVMCGASESYFCRLFKHDTGMTFLNYLNGLRVERACVLLRDTCDSALEICYQVGFNEYTHFGRQFKKNTGMSPAEYRKSEPRLRQIHVA